MTRWMAFWTAMALVTGCGGSQQGASGGEREGAGERAGKSLDKAAGNVKETGDEVGSEVGKSFGDASKDIKGKLGIDEQKDAGAPSPPNDAGK